MIAVNCPRAMSTSTWSRATTRVSPDPYALTTCRARAATAVRPPVPPCLGMVTADVTVYLLCRSADEVLFATSVSLVAGGGPARWCPAQSSTGENPTPVGPVHRPQRHKARLRTASPRLVLRRYERPPSPSG